MSLFDTTDYTLVDTPVSSDMRASWPACPHFEATP